jgi:hypothetical protein
MVFSADGHGSSTLSFVLIGSLQATGDMGSVGKQGYVFCWRLFLFMKVTLYLFICNLSYQYNYITIRIIS